jgi:hypothetical protein
MENHPNPEVKKIALQSEIESSEKKKASINQLLEGLENYN